MKWVPELGPERRPTVSSVKFLFDTAVSSEWKGYKKKTNITKILNEVNTMRESHLHNALHLTHVRALLTYKKRVRMSGERGPQ